MPAEAHASLATSGQDRSGGHAGGLSTTGSATRSRPCDTCRVRKTRCVREQDQLRCVLCAFHNQPCTFLRGPTRRRRRPIADAPSGARAASGGGRIEHPQAPDPGTAPALAPTSLGECFHPPHDGPRGSGSLGGSPVSSPHTEDTDTEHDTSPSHTLPSPDGLSRVLALRPRILSNTLGLDLKTHAEFVGLTDYREPVLLDLHQPRPASPLPSSDLGKAEPFARRLDHRTTFLVYPDESAGADLRRIADLDAIEAAVQPLGRTLVDLYFRVVHPSFPILHKDVFISKHRVSHRHFDPSLLAAVYLVALDWQLYDSSLAGRELESIPATADLEQLAERTMSQDMLRPKLSTLEAGLLLLQRSRSPTASTSHAYPTSRRVFTAQLVAMAQDLGIHVDCTSWSMPGWEVGLRRRLAWALYVQDRWGAAAHGRPFLIQDAEWDVQPCTADDYPELDAGSDTGHDSSASAISNGWDLFVRHIELSRFLGEILDNFYSVTATRAGGRLDQMGIVATVEFAKPLIFRLREWHANLPAHLRMDSTNSRDLCANGALHLAYLSIEIALYRALVRRITPETPETLYTALRSTARAKVQDAVAFLGALRPEHTAAFWGSASTYQVAQVGSLAGLLWATADSSDEMAWCAAQVEDLRWALRVRGAAAPFLRESLRLLERHLGGLGVVTPRRP